MAFKHTLNRWHGNKTDSPPNDATAPQSRHRLPSLGSRISRRDSEMTSDSPTSSSIRGRVGGRLEAARDLIQGLESKMLPHVAANVQEAKPNESEVEGRPTRMVSQVEAAEIEDEDVLSPVTVAQMAKGLKSLQKEVVQLKYSLRSIIHEEIDQGLRSTLTNELKNFFERLVIEPVNQAPVVQKRDAPEVALLPTMALEKKSIAVSGIAEKKSVELSGTTSAANCGVPSALAEPLLPKASREPPSPKSVKSEDAVTRRSSLLKQDMEDKQRMKTMLKEAMEEEPRWNVEDLYSETGIWQALARQDSCFSTASLAVVVANVIWIGIDEDLNTADVLSNAPPLSIVVNNIFCAFFTFELIAKFLAYKRKCDSLRCPGFLFDFVIVLFMVWETWIEVAMYSFFHFSDNSSTSAVSLFRFFRLFRLTRLPRVFKLSAALPELMILAKGIAAAMRSVTVIMLFMGIVIFFFGIIFTDLLRGVETFTDRDDFSDVGTSMNTLLLQVLCGPDSDFMMDLLKVNWVYYVLYLVFLFMTLLTLMNMLIGVLCDIVSGTADEEKEDMALKKIEYDIGMIAKSIDEDNDGSISKSEFEQLMNHKDTLKSLDSVGVDVVTFGSLSGYFFAEDEELTLSEFCQLVASFRGGRSATKQDLIDMQRFFTRELGSLTSDVHSIHLCLERAFGKPP